MYGINKVYKGININIIMSINNPSYKCTHPRYYGIIYTVFKDETVLFLECKPNAPFLDWLFWNGGTFLRSSSWEPPILDSRGNVSLCWKIIMLQDFNLYPFLWLVSRDSREIGLHSTPIPLPLIFVVRILYGNSNKAFTN